MTKQQPVPNIPAFAKQAAADIIEKYINAYRDVTVNVIHKAHAYKRLGYEYAGPWRASYTEVMGVVVASFDQALLARAIGLLPECDLIVLDPRFMSPDNPHFGQLGRVLDFLPVVFDVRDDDCPISEGIDYTGSGTIGTMPVYKGEWDKAFAMGYAKTMFDRKFEDAWFLFYSAYSFTQTQKVNLAYGLSLGDEGIYIPTGRGSGSKLPTWKVEVLSKARIETPLDADPEVRRALDTLSKLDEYFMFWQNVTTIDDNRYIKVPDSAVESKAAAVRHFEEILERLEMTSAMDALHAGVPVQDIFV